MKTIEVVRKTCQSFHTDGLYHRTAGKLEIGSPASPKNRNKMVQTEMEFKEMEFEWTVGVYFTLK